MKKLALIQHPMWLIIKEDRLCAEAVPPWGAASLDDYAARIGRNLNVVESNPAVRLNYEFGGFELEDLVARYPELYERMRAMVRAGRLHFVNGTYSQGHGHVLSLEANIRQLEHGLGAIERLFGVRVRTHAPQEPDYTNQMPQLLCALGFEFAWYGAFLHDLQTPLGRGPEPSLLYRWVGLDGTAIPLMIDQNGFGINIDRREPAELQRDPNFVFVKAPDLQEFDVQAEFVYVALDEALREQLRLCAPEVDARLQVPWSYVEGTDGDTLLQEIFRCEQALIRLETLTSLLDETFSADTLEPLWKRWLAAQHHDGLWHGAPELREKQRQWCRAVAAEADQRLFALPGLGGGAGSDFLHVATVYPACHQGVLRVRCAGQPPRMLRGVAREIPVQIEKQDADGADLLVPFNAAGCTWGSFQAEGAGDAPRREAVTEGFSFANAFYRADVTAYGGISRLYDASGRELFRNTAANHRDFTVEGLRQQAHMGLKHHRVIGLGWTDCDAVHYQYGLDSLGALTVMADGRLQAYALSRYRSERVRGPVADVLISTGQVGPIPVTRKTYLFHDLPWIEMEITCTFNQTVIDAYPEDSHKLCVWWPYWYRDLITSGIPGGSETPSRPEMAFFPVSWLDIDHMDYGQDHNFGVPGGGLAIAYESSLKTFRRDGRIGTVLAWGDNQGHFSNHNMALKWRAILDLRLNGTRTYRFRLFPHAGSWRDAGVPAWAMALQRPPAVWWTREGAVQNREMLVLEGSGLVPTSVRRADGTLRVRFHEAHGRETRIETARREGRAAEAVVTGLDGHRWPSIGAFRIGEVQI